MNKKIFYYPPDAIIDPSCGENMTFLTGCRCPGYCLYGIFKFLKSHNLRLLSADAVTIFSVYLLKSHPYIISSWAFIIEETLCLGSNMSQKHKLPSDPHDPNIFGLFYMRFSMHRSRRNLLVRMPNDLIYGCFMVIIGKFQGDFFL